MARSTRVIGSRPGVAAPLLLGNGEGCGLRDPGSHMGLEPFGTERSTYRPAARPLAVRVIAALRDLAGLWRVRGVPPSARRRHGPISYTRPVRPLQFIGVLPRDITEEKAR